MPYQSAGGLRSFSLTTPPPLLLNFIPNECAPKVPFSNCANPKPPFPRCLPCRSVNITAARGGRAATEHTGRPVFHVPGRGPGARGPFGGARVRARGVVGSSRQHRSVFHWR
ncbi:hypothetical protein AAFF_G00066410 [Aldrovandia affinis]|uniref:Uncharacterized protein n=1 Tax=Aldrovandia affinis TaxID=143900 RepID=A0AAD7WYX3_9TELE|nr:hypothetical protein AAFF_G00066410 [Aldrovandia affinis]